MIQDVKNRPISELFDIDSKVIYYIPRYQREYIWVNRHWESLLNDILENDPGYFIGSIICINQSKDALSTQLLEVVDGQQRLITISLLFAAIYKSLKKHVSSMDEDYKNELFNLKNKMLLKKTTQIRVIPQIQNENQDDYRAVLSEIGFETFHVPFRAGNRKIFKAFRYFHDRIEEMIDNHSSDLAIIMQFLDKVNQASIVKIEVNSHSHAYTLFESLNNRGTPLTAIDLIKNKLLASLESKDPGSDEYYKNWNRLLDYLSDDYTIQERFFRQYYNAFRDDLKAIYLVPIATRSNLMKIYEKLIDHDAKDCLQKISIAGKQYAMMLFRNQDSIMNGLEKPLKDLERIQGAPSYLLMLFLLIRKERLKIEEYHLAEIVKGLVRFFVRRNLTDTPPTRDLTRLFMSIIGKLNEVIGTDVVRIINDQLISISATDEIFRQKLDGQIYKENSGVTRFVLCSLAEQRMTKETWVDLWKIENKQLIWTIEHIFPQGENIPQSWVTMIGTGDAKKAKESQESHVHKLGNLTVSGFNPSLGNNSFEEKRDRKDKEGRYVGYKNGLSLNEDLANAEQWSVAQIDARTTTLVNKAMELFKLNG